MEEEESFRKEGLENNSDAVEKNLWLSVTLNSLLEFHHGEDNGFKQTKEQTPKEKKKK